MTFLWFGLILSFLIFVHEFGHFIVARRLGVRVECFSLGFGPRIFGWKRGKTDYRLSLIPVGGYVKLAGETAEAPLTGKPWEYLSQPIVNRVSIVAAGPLVNYIVAFFLFFSIFVTGNPQSSNKIGQVIEKFPAEQAGLRVGDRIVLVAGQSTPYWEDVQRRISSHLEGGKLSLEVERQGRRFALSILPRVVEEKDPFGKVTRRALIGIAASEEMLFVRYSVSQAFSKASRQIFSLTAMTLKALGKLVTGGLAMKESLTGPVGIFFITRQAAHLGFPFLLQICAVLSASLAIFNFLPIPALDGGHLLFLGIEALKGRPVSERVQELSRQIGFYFLIGLMVFVLYNDLVRHFGGMR